MKDRIKTLVIKLRASGDERRTEQGAILYGKFLDIIDQSTTVAELLATLRIINKSLAGIEAHGFFTNEEFQWVLELRDIENELSSKT